MTMEEFVPDGDGLGDCVDVIVLVFGPVVHGACEGVQAAVVIQGLRRQLGLPGAVAHHAGLTEEVRLHLGVVGQQVVVELGALKLALEGPGGAGVRLGDVAVIASGSGSGKRLGGCPIGAVDGRLVRENPRGKVAAWSGFVPAGRSVGHQLRFGIGRCQRLGYRVSWKHVKQNPDESSVDHIT